MYILALTRNPIYTYGMRRCWRRSFYVLPALAFLFMAALYLVTRAVAEREYGVSRFVFLWSAS